MASRAEQLFIEALGYFDAADYRNAELRLREALALAPGNGSILTNLSVVYWQQKRFKEAREAAERAVATNAKNVEALLILAGSHLRLGNFSDAVAAYEKIVTLEPNLVDAWLSLAKSLAGARRPLDAVNAYNRVIALRPDHAEAWQARGERLGELGQISEELRSYDRAFAIKPDLPYLAGARLFAKMWLCDWGNLAAEIADLVAGVRSGAPVVEPLILVAIPATPSDQLACAKSWFAAKFSHLVATSRPEPQPQDRIRIAYLSADFRDHPVGFLIAGMLEQHDQSQFETFGVSFGPYRETPIRDRLVRAFTHFIEVSDRTDEEVAAMLRDLQIDIAVDLGGYTRAARPGILAGRPAPIQVTYLGFPGTSGSPCIDYIIADRFVIAPESRRYYAEQVTYLPDCYMANDTSRKIGRLPTRAEAGLPENGFIFCSFNNSFKITPDVFDIWMRLLRGVVGSVLWLSAAPTNAIANLRREAERRGIAGERLIFAQRVESNEDHLARLCLAGLFLDTPHYNAHTTAADALWAGVPVLTRPGATFASRVAGSLLTAIGLPELIVQSEVEYEALALKLALDGALLSEIKVKLTRHRSTYPLFDTARFTRHLEAAYFEMWQRHRHGDPPQSFSVDVLPVTGRWGETSCEWHGHC